MEGEAALRDGIDFYYLRVRLGIACFERKDYHRALRHFEKALAFYDSEAYVREYLYYASLYSGRTQEAEKYARRLRDSAGAGPYYPKQFFIRQLELSYNLEMNQDPMTAGQFVANVDSTLPGSQYVPNQRNSFRLGLSHVVSPAFVLHHAYTYVNQQYFFYRQRDRIRTVDEDYKTNVHQYFISGQIRLAKNWALTPGIHYLGVRYPAPIAPSGSGPRWQRATVFTSNQFALFLHLSKMFPYVSLEGSVYYANLNAARQLQADVLLHTFPLGNLNLYTTTTFSSQWERADGVTRPRYVLTQRIGGKIARFLWLDGYAGIGQLQNYFSNYGALVYNGAGAVRLYAGAMLTFPLGKHIRLQAAYSYVARESYFYAESSEDLNAYNGITTKNHSLTGGLQWDFLKSPKY